MDINICMSILDDHQGCNGYMELHESHAWPYGPPAFKNSHENAMTTWAELCIEGDPCKNR